MKNLCAAKIREITCGAAWIGEADGMLVFHRFTKEQEAFYARRNPQYAGKVASTAGVRCLFKTDSKRLRLRIRVQPGTSRRYFAMDVTVNGEYVGSLSNLDGVDPQTDYTAGDFPLGDFEGEFSLGDGEKEVAILFPWSVETRLSALALDDGATVTPAVPQRTLLAFGDSVTQGYDVLHPRNTYVERMAAALHLTAYNKAIGGEIMVPGLAGINEAVAADIITVAYGTNDWCTRDSADAFEADAELFFAQLRRRYSDATIVCITPIFRTDGDAQKPFGPFETAAARLQIAADEYSVYLVDGMTLVPHDTRFYADKQLHPNDDGAAHYAAALLQAIEQPLKFTFL